VNDIDPWITDLAAKLGDDPGQRTAFAYGYLESAVAAYLAGSYTKADLRKFHTRITAALDVKPAKVGGQR